MGDRNKAAHRARWATVGLSSARSAKSGRSPMRLSIVAVAHGVGWRVSSYRTYFTRVPQTMACFWKDKIFL